MSGYELRRKGVRVASEERLIDLPVPRDSDVIWDIERAELLTEEEIAYVCDREIDAEHAAQCADVAAWLAWGVA